MSEVTITIETENTAVKKTGRMIDFGGIVADTLLAHYIAGNDYASVIEILAYAASKAGEGLDPGILCTGKGKGKDEDFVKAIAKFTAAADKVFDVFYMEG